MGRRFETGGGADGDSDEIGRRTMLGATLAGLAGVGVAASTPSRGAGVQDLPNELVIRSQSDRVEYEFAVDGELEPGDDSGDSDDIDGSSVTGVIDGAGVDDYFFSGEITTFEITEGADYAQVTLNGDGVDPEELGSGSAQSEPEERFPHELTLTALSDDVEYRVALDGQFDPASVSGDDDELEEAGVVVGQLEEEDDEVTYGYFGPEVTVEIAEGVAALGVDRGEPRATKQGDDWPLPARVLFFGLGDTTRYRFTVSDELEFGEAAETEDTGIPADERVDDTTVEGYVHAHDDDPLADDYYFSGAIEVERAAAPVRVRMKW